MDKFDRVQKLHRIFLSHRYPVSLRFLEGELECSTATVKRDIDILRDYCSAPIINGPSGKGWLYDKSADNFELPSLWLTADELQSMVLLLSLLRQTGEGILNDELAVIEKQIHKLLSARKIDPGKLTSRFKVLPIAHKSLANKIFIGVGEALIQQKQALIQYTSYSQQKSRRTISPQTLFYYRDNWYLDAWCHKRKDLRIFSLARINRLVLTDSPAKEVDRQERINHFEGGYGVFAGQPKHTAILRFLPAVAHEIATQQWHPQQQGNWEGNDYCLQFPYSDDRELIGDILRHMPDLIVEAPEILKNNVRDRLKAGLEVQE